MTRDRLNSILVLVPSIVLIAIFVYGFIAWTVYTSMTNSNALQQLSGQTAVFQGLSNYADLFHHESAIASGLQTRFRIDMANTFFFTILFIAMCLVLGLTLAILLDQQVIGEGLFRTIFLFPMALSFVVTGVVWKWLFNPDAGINRLPTLVGLPQGEFRWFISEERWLEFDWANVPNYLAIVVLGVFLFVALQYWRSKRSTAAAIFAALALLLMTSITLDIPRQAIALKSETQGFNVALFAVVLAAGWQMSGYTMAMYLAGLRGISEDLREAARVDGATEVGVYRHVVLPLLQPITLSAVIILGHISLKIFDLVYTMAGDTNFFIDMPGINMYLTTFRASEFGRGAAIATVMLISVAVVIVPYLVTSLRSEEGR